MMMQMENHQEYMCLTLSSPREEGEVSTPITDQQTDCIFLGGFFNFLEEKKFCN